jgi:LEA14-like dessication related protein
MKKILVIVLSVLIIINIIIGAFLFLDIRILKAPIIGVELDPVTFSPTEIVLEAHVRITNPNPFDVSIENFNVISTTIDGYEIGRFFIQGGDIPANENKTFIAQNHLGFNGHDYTQIKNTITTDITISVLGIITKTIPFEITINASLANITSTLTVPHVHLQATLDDITKEGVLFSGTVELYNPNLFEITATSLSMTLKNEKNESLGTVSLQGGILEPAGFLTRTINGTLLFKAVDANSINANLSGMIGVTAAGINKTLPFSVEIQFLVPDPIKLLGLNGSFDFNLTGNFKLRMRGVICYIDFSIYNPSKIPIDARDLVCTIYRLDKNTTRLLGQQNMTPCTIEPKQEECLSTNIILPYFKLLFSGGRRILPDWFILTMRGNISISGVNRSLPIAITGYLEPHFIFNTTASPRLHI